MSTADVLTSRVADFLKSFPCVKRFDCQLHGVFIYPDPMPDFARDGDHSLEQHFYNAVAAFPINHAAVADSFADAMMLVRDLAAHSDKTSRAMAAMKTRAEKAEAEAALLRTRLARTMTAVRIIRELGED